jgi:hypothetical protein
MTTASSPSLSPPTDFADWLSPILVKELRQGLKTRVFVATFIIVQIVMIVLMGLQLISLANGVGSGTSGAFEGFFWGFIWIAILLLMPARGLSAISEETKANTLDLVQLTRLSAFRIVFGKWVALTTQTLMILASILPYAVLRYFFGGVDIVEDLKNIAILSSVSLVLTAGTIALSTAHLAVRIIMVVGAFMAYVVIGAFMSARAFGVMSGGSSIQYIGEWWFQLLTLPIYVLTLLEIAASKIATASENHAAKKRSLALLLALVLPICAACQWNDFGLAWFTSFAPVWIWIVVEALCEKSSDVPSLYVPIVRRGTLGKLAGRLMLYPGWASGIFFTFLLILFGVASFEFSNLRSGSPMKADEVLATRIFFVLFTASVISPVILLLFMPRAKQRMWFYVLFQLLTGLIYLVCSISADLPTGERTLAYRWLAPFPTSALLASLQKSNDLPLMSFYLTTAVPVAVLVILFLIVKAILEFRRIRVLEEHASLEANKPPVAR